MNRIQRISLVPLLCAALLIFGGAIARADDAGVLRKLYAQARPSLVVVKYTFDNELKPQELITGGVVVGDDGLVMIPLYIVSPTFVPDGQMKDFKIIVPSDTEDEQEIDADLVGRDERSLVAFIHAKTPQTWHAAKFVDQALDIGDTVYAMGLLPKSAGYRAFITQTTVSAKLRGPVPQILVNGDLAGAGSLALNANGEVVGYVEPRGLFEAVLDNPQNPDAMPMIYSPPKTFVPSSFFMLSLDDPPTAGTALNIPWLGIPQSKGLEKEFAEFFGLTNTPAIQVGDIAPGSPAERAGLKTLDIIIKMNGQPLERGDVPAELPLIFREKIQRMKIGQQVTLTVIHHKGDEPKDLAITLETRPRQISSARRYYAQDLGFVAREVMFDDTYQRKLSQTTGGVVIALLKPQGPAAAAQLGESDLVTEMNGKPVTDLDQFKKDYQQFRKDKPHDAVVLVVSHVDGKEQTVNIQPPQGDSGM